MRRIVFAVTALAALAVATAAFAASGSFNSYTGSTLGFKPNKAGSVASPAPMSITDNYVANGTNGNRTAPLTDILTKLYGVVVDQKDFPTCSLAQLSAAKNDTGCPKGSLIATGTVRASIGPQATPTVAAGVPCFVILHVYNSGKGKVTFFFRTDATHVCFNGAITTGTVGPYQGTFTKHGKWLWLDVPIPTYVSFPLGAGHVTGSLEAEHLTYFKMTRKVHGKTVAFQASTGCLHGKRPFALTFTATNFNGVPGNTTVNGAVKCTR
jgi:hypothetical protein